ncbi:MAG: TonB-dependent receptor [Flavobacteriaceae bacterium]|nr:TonB-dependent receptor [Flavobacteriaceae bacterium]
MNTRGILLIALFSLLIRPSFSQENSQIEQLDSVIISSSRIDIPFKESSRTIEVITAAQIEKSPSNNVADLLQNVAGIDVRRRGVDGMQSDIYIRGGHFNQTLILIDGIKTEDPQTGHHTMNMMIPLENIERIEIIKGPAARIFGQNAFLGAINIVTKKHVKNNLSIDLKTGSYKRAFVGVTGALNFEKSSHQVHFSNNTSDGYRTNTDFKNQNYFVKSSLKTKNEPINILASFAERKFGANNFYTNSPSFNEYEETQTSLVGVSTKFVKNNFTIKPKVYWKRNQDMFLLRREDPSFSRNFNISNKIGAEVNTSYKSKLGTTGIGVDFAKVSLASNNLGDQDRTQFNTFIEHRFLLADNKLDITPGVSLNYFSDFDFNAFPGLDIGYKINDKLKVYGNIGVSYRIPTYTELYINIPNFLSGNDALKPEKALAEEIGIKYSSSNFKVGSAFFRREAKDLIDYVKETATSTVFLAQNLRKITTTGFEVNTSYKFKINDQIQNIKLGYTFLEDDYHDTNVFSSRYLLNTSIKHHFTASFDFELFKALQPSISYRYVERPTNSYTIVDAKLSAKIKQFAIFITGNNIFNTEYSEENNIPMPKGNVLFGLKYSLK